MAGCEVLKNESLKLRLRRCTSCVAASFLESPKQERHRGTGLCGWRYFFEAEAPMYFGVCRAGFVPSPPQLVHVLHHAPTFFFFCGRRSAPLP